MKKVCFFARVKDPSDLDSVEFYARDIQILNKLGFEVVKCTKITQLIKADFYFVWWWTWAFVPVFIAKVFKRPVFITGVFNCWSFNDRPWYQRKLIEFSVRNSTLNIPVSKLEYKQLSGMFPNCSFYYSPLVIDVEEYKAINSQRQEFIYTTATMVSGNAERKCIRELIGAAAIVHKFYPRLKFIFAGKYDVKYKEYAESLGANNYIEFPGEISKDDKINYLRSCLLYAQPSRFEGFGVGILEAILCGAPVVTSRVGAVEEVVGPYAVYVDGTSVESISSGIISLVDDFQLRNELSERGRDRSEKLFGFTRRFTDINTVILQRCNSSL